MANTEVTLIHTGDAYVPSVASVPVVSGETVSFATSDGSSALAFFSPDALAVLSPKPVNPLIIGPGSKAPLSFSSSNSGAYSVFFTAAGGSGPAHFPSGNSQTLRFEVSGPEPPPFDNPLNRGH